MKKSKTLWITVALVCATLALIAWAGQAVSARPATRGLTPPFKFVEEAQLAQPETLMPPTGSTVLMTETFGTAFTATTSLQGTTPLWRVAVNEDDTAGYYWGRSGVSNTIAVTNSVWNAGRLFTVTQVLTPGLSTYPAGQDTWLVYGPIDLSRYSVGYLSFESYLDSAAGDTLLWAFSPDGQTFYGSTQSGSFNEWISSTYAFRSNPSYQTVYIAFAFSSQSTPQGKGAFIRNVRLSGNPLNYTYLSLVANNYAVPTPTPTPPLFGYTFDEGNTTDLAAWGGAYYHTGTTKYGQCIPGQCTMHYTTPRGNPANSLRLYTNGLYSFIASSPNDIAPDDFDLYVDMSPWVIYPRSSFCPFGCPTDDWGDWYGIIFNASTATFGSNPSQFVYGQTYYRVFFYNGDSVKPIAIRLERCDGGSGGKNSCHKLGESSLPSNFIGGAGGFDTVHIKRLASGPIEVSVNDTVLITTNDATYTGSAHGKFGTFIFSWTQNATQDPPTGYEMQIDFDNIKLYNR